MVGVFVIIVGIIFIRPLLHHKIYLTALLPFMAVFLLLGVTLIVLTVKTKMSGMLNKFLLLTGASAVGLLVCAILHNVVSGLFHIEEPVFFILGLIVCPIAFLVGAIGTIVLAIKNKPSVPSGTP
jgi:hypothetical protein